MSDWKMIKPKTVECYGCGKQINEGYWDFSFPVCESCKKKTSGQEDK